MKKCVIFVQYLKQLNMDYTAIIKVMSNGWYFAQCEQIPGEMTQGETVEEAFKNLKEAIQLVLEAEVAKL